jgi:glutamine amidotransferase
LIAVIDYGMGNLRSVQKGLERAGLPARITSSRRDLEDAAGVVLPGVGAFRDCMRNLDRLHLIEPIKKAVHGGKPFLGICLGLQILFRESEEFGPSPGLGLFPGRVVRFQEDRDDPSAPGLKLKVPHMGWNQITLTKETPFFKGIEDGAYFYFVHSYYVVPEDSALAATVTEYGGEFVSSIARDNLFACQFHPEKSQQLGIKLLQNFGDLVHEH